jgi:hypothetical protein
VGRADPLLCLATLSGLFSRFFSVFSSGPNLFQMVKDLRTDYETNDIEDVLDGNLDPYNLGPCRSQLFYLHLLVCVFCSIDSRQVYSPGTEKRVLMG